jgi:hypothetical protein
MVKILFIKYVLLVPNYVPPLMADKNSKPQATNSENHLKAAFFSTLSYWLIFFKFQNC